MREASSLVAWLWAAFFLCWLVLARFNKKASKSGPWRLAWASRLAIVGGVLVVLSFRRHAGVGLIASIGRSLPLHPGIPGQWLGVGLCLAGFGLAFWARTHLGRNWGMPMSLRRIWLWCSSGETNGRSLDCWPVWPLTFSWRQESSFRPCRFPL